MRSRLVVAVILLAGLAVVLYDLYGPRRGRLGAFDPSAVATLETEMWRAAQAGDDGRRFRFVARQLRVQFHVPLLRSYSAAYDMARALYLFDQGRARSEYEGALPHLERYYRAIRPTNAGRFDTAQAARLGLEVWILRRQRDEHTNDEVAGVVRDLHGLLYGVEPARLAEHARLRAEALELRDARAAEGGPSHEEWQRIEDLLRRSWEELRGGLRS